MELLFCLSLFYVLLDVLVLEWKGTCSLLWIHLFWGFIFLHFCVTFQRIQKTKAVFFAVILIHPSNHRGNFPSVIT